MSKLAHNDQWFRQGSHDGLCGFYATLNAVWSLVPDVHDEVELTDYLAFDEDARIRRFYDDAISLLARVGGISINTLHSRIGGVDEYQLEELVGKMARYWRQPLSTVMLHEAQNDLPMSELIKSEDEKGKFALLASVNDGGHWVTICKIDGRFRIIDPDALTAGDHPIVTRANAPDPKLLIRLGNGAS